MMKRLLLLCVCLMAWAVRADEWFQVRIEYSDGSVKNGRLAILGNRPLTLNPAGSKYQRKILLSDVASIDQVVEKQSMNRPWAYKESGRNERIYFDGEYPFIEFGTAVTLTGGEIVRGHVISLPFRFESGKSKEKFFLPRQIKGKVGQTMEQTVYPVRVVFDNPKAVVKDIVVKMSGLGKTVKVAALDCRRENVIFADPDKDGGYRFSRLLPGAYDLFILTDEYALAGMSGAGPDAVAAGEPLPSGSMAELQKVFPLADDFFKDRWILDLQGNSAFAKTLVYKRRADFYAADKHTSGGFVWHLDIWSWHLAGKEWKIDRRYIMLRHKQQGSEKIRRLYFFDRLAGVSPGATLELKAEDLENGGKFIRNLD